MSYFPAILSDPQLAISKRDRNIILGAASSAWFKKPLNQAVYMSAVIAWVVFMAVTMELFGRTGSNQTLYTVLLWVILLPLYLLGLHYLIFHIRFRPYLYQALHDKGYDICLTCSYLLIDIPESSTKCPECGSPRSPLLEHPKADST